MSGQCIFIIIHMQLLITTYSQGCRVLVFMWNSDSRIRKFRTPDSDYNSKTY